MVAVKPALKPLVLNPALNVTRVVDQSGLDKLKDFFQRNKIIGWDIETNPLKDYFWRRTRTIQFGNQTEQYVIDLRAFCGGDSEILYQSQGHYGLKVADCLRPVLDTITPVLASAEWLKCGVNLGFEYQNFYWQFGIRAFNFYSCDMVERCIWAGAHSMKDYSFYSMEEMMARYFQVQIDKSLQESFDIDGDLSDEQIEYAALDTRYPLAIRAVQALIIGGETYDTLKKKNHPAAKYLHPDLIDPIITGDNLTEICTIENNAIGAFEDMRVHGERLDRPRWLERVAKAQAKLNQVILEKLDPIFLPIVGDKSIMATDEEIAAAEAYWKSFNVVSEAETELKQKIRAAKKLTPHLVPELEAEMDRLKVNRIAEKEIHKETCSKQKKHRTAVKNLAAKCEGKALINYGSDAQLLKILNGMKGLKGIDNLEDETLEKYSHIPAMAAIREYHGYKKEVGTYGVQWATEWTTKPCKEEGWLHPGDGRLHCIFNQYDAETGRSTSEKPNGQNLPQDKEVRSCFIADPPDESIRISVCCEADTEFVPIEHEWGLHRCMSCGQQCETKAEEYVIVTADMSGAELRIIAELAEDEVWIEAFARGEDVHSVGTEILYAEQWPKLQLSGDLLKNKKSGQLEPYWCEYFKLVSEEEYQKNPKRTIGDLMRQKCECPEHKELRDGNKSTNFLLAYGGGPATLSVRIKKTLEQARELMLLHSYKFPKIWAYLEKSGNMAKILMKAFDMYGRRRIFPKPDWDRATQRAKEDREEKLRLDDAEAAKNVELFVQLHGRKPDKEEKWLLTHRLPTSKEVANAYKAMHGTIERQGKNHSIQGTNATIAKLAMGAGYCSNGKPFLWHTLPQFKAKLIKFVHDELVVQCPKRYGKKVAALIGDAFKRAAAEKMKKVVMEFDFNIAAYWKK